MNNSLRHQYLNSIGIQTWLLKSSPDIMFIENQIETDTKLQQINNPLYDNVIQADEVTEANQQPKVQVENIVKPQVETVSDIPIEAETFKHIDSCALCSSRKNHLQVLTGNGFANADVFFVCEAPTVDEDREGHYLTGDVQSLFSKMLDAISISKQYFFTGLVKCHSLDEYLVSQDDISNCSEHLIKQLEEFKPKIIVLLGSVQAQSVLKSSETFNQLRNKIHNIEINNKFYQAIVSYHPAFLLRNPLYKREALKDLIMIKSIISTSNDQKNAN